MEGKKERSKEEGRGKSFKGLLSSLFFLLRWRKEEGEGKGFFVPEIKK